MKRLKGDLIGELYHSLSYTLIEIMLKEPQCQVLYGVSLEFFLKLWFASFKIRVFVRLHTEYCVSWYSISVLIGYVRSCAGFLQVGLSLAYHNLDSELPTQSTITAWPLSSDLISQTASKKPGRAVLKNSTAFRLPKAEAFLRTMPLRRGFEEFLGDLRDTLGLSPPQLVVEAPQPPMETPQLGMEVPQVTIEAPQVAMEASEPAMEAPQPTVEVQPLSNEAQPMETEAPGEAPH